MKNLNKILIFLSDKNIHSCKMTIFKSVGPNDAYESNFQFENPKQTISLKMKLTIVDLFGNYYLDLNLKAKGYQEFKIETVDSLEALNFLEKSFEQIKNKYS